TQPMDPGARPLLLLKHQLPTVRQIESAPSTDTANANERLHDLQWALVGKRPGDERGERALVRAQRQRRRPTFLVDEVGVGVPVSDDVRNVGQVSELGRVPHPLRLLQYSTDR